MHLYGLLILIRKRFLFVQACYPTDGKRSEHTTWARATLALARLAQLDPGGNLGNRPRRSLRETFILWHPQTAALWEGQLRVLGTVLEREPAVGWNLHVDLMPKFNVSLMDRSGPEWREWLVDQSPTLTTREWSRRLRDVLTQMMTVVGVNGDRSSDLIGAIPELPNDLHDHVVSSLERLDAEALQAEARAKVWSALRTVLAHHRPFPDADSALPANRLNRLEALYVRFEPTESVARYGWLFSDAVVLPHGRRNDWVAEERKIAEARRDGVEAIYESSGSEGIELLASVVDNPYHLGGAFGANDRQAPEYSYPK